MRVSAWTFATGEGILGWRAQAHQGGMGGARKIFKIMPFKRNSDAFLA